MQAVIREKCWRSQKQRFSRYKGSVAGSTQHIQGSERKPVWLQQRVRDNVMSGKLETWAGAWLPETHGSFSLCVFVCVCVYVHGKNGKPLKGIQWKGEGSSHCDVENGCREPKRKEESSEAVMSLSRQETMVAQIGWWQQSGQQWSSFSAPWTKAGPPQRPWHRTTALEYDVHAIVKMTACSSTDFIVYNHLSQPLSSLILKSTTEMRELKTPNLFCDSRLKNKNNNHNNFVFLYKDTLFHMYCWLINIELMTKSTIKHAWVKLMKHTYFLHKIHHRFLGLEH